MHLAGSGRVIIRLKGPLPEGQIIGDRDGNKIAKVAELIGPTAAPYASAIPIANDAKRYEGKKVYAIDSAPARRRKRK